MLGVAILAPGGRVPCRARDSDIVVDATWNTKIFVGKAGEEEKGVGSVRKNKKEQPRNS